MKLRRTFYTLVTFLLFSAVQANAQNTVKVNIGPDGMKSASQARSIALTNTVMPIGVGLGSVALFSNDNIQTVGAGLAVYGLIMGPSTGNFYAEDYPRGVVGMGVRAIGAYLMVDATREIFGNEFADALKIDDQDVSLTDTKILIGELLVLGSVVYNIWSSSRSVEEYNSSKKPFAINIDAADVQGKVAPMLTAKIRL